VQAICPRTDVEDRKQVVYNLFAAYLQTMPLEELTAWNERGETRNLDMS
jgi:hypothetical protein